MDFIYEEYDIGIPGEFVQDCLDTLLELSPVLCACHHSGHIKAYHPLVEENTAHFSVDDAQCQSLHNRTLSHTRLTDKHRIVLLAARKNLGQALDLALTANYRVKSSIGGRLGHIEPELVKSRSICSLLSLGGGVSARATPLLGTAGNISERTVSSGLLVLLFFLLAERACHRLAGTQLLLGGRTVGDCNIEIQVCFLNVTHKIAFYRFLVVHKSQEQMLAGNILAMQLFSLAGSKTHIPHGGRCHIDIITPFVAEDSLRRQLVVGVMAEHKVFLKLGGNIIHRHTEMAEDADSGPVIDAQNGKEKVFAGDYLRACLTCLLGSKTYHFLPCTVVWCHSISFKS